MHRNPHHISGIHNYCDRWCERCAFTARCAVFAMQAEQTPEEQDIRNEAFWKSLSHNFSEIRQLLNDSARKWGIDLDAVPDNEWKEIQKRQEDIRVQVNSHPLSQLTTEYYKAADQFFATHNLLETESEKLIQQVEMGLQNDEWAHSQLVQEKDCLEVIRWYLFFIHTKFSRALSGLLEDDGWEEENGFQRDCDGSAKVALIAVERSIQAWAQLLQFLPEHEDKILPLLAMLQKTQRLARNSFPKADSFIRPGFDTAALA